MFPLNDSKASSFESATPAAIPINPISTELPTCPIPQRIVIQIVLILLHFRALESTTNGK